MKPALFTLAALVAALPTVAAASPPAPSAFAIPLVDAVATLAPAPVVLATCDAAAPLASGTVLAAIRYEPRYEPRPSSYYQPQSHSYRATSASQLHMGFFEPSNTSMTPMVFGFRAGGLVDEHVQIGVNADWHYKTQDQVSILSQQTLPGGTPAQVTQVLSRVTTNLVPLLGYLQIGGSQKMPISPYVGGGAGYEWYFVRADDFSTNSSYSADYGGFGWQVWAGLQVPLGVHSRLIAEAFMNQAELGRNVTVNGLPYRETVNLNGGGGRFGLSFLM